MTYERDFKTTTTNTYKFALGVRKKINLADKVFYIFESKHYYTFRQALEAAVAYVNCAKLFAPKFGWEGAEASVFIQNPVSGAYTQVHTTYGDNYTAHYSDKSEINEHVLYALNNYVPAAK